MDSELQNAGSDDGSRPPQSQSAPPQASKKRWLIVITVVLLLGISVTIGLIVSHKRVASPGSSGNSAAAEKLFDDMLSAAAAKQRVRLTYVQQEYADKADFEAKKLKRAQYSVAQLDVNTKEYRSVYASQQGTDSRPYFVVRRCLEQGTMYKPAQADIDVKTLAEAQAILAKPLPSTVPAGRTEAKDCDLNNSDHPGRITDGVIPAGLDQNQIQNWLQALKEAEFITVEDKGTTTYHQKTVRKLHFVTSSLAGAFTFFHVAQKSANLQLTDAKGNPGADAYRIEEMASTDNIDGFYLVDEQTKLPVYSEFTALSLLVSNKGEAGEVMKQIYEYPSTATLGQNTTIDTLKDLQ